MELRDRHQASEVYTIRQVAELTGVPENTIRSWERRFGIPQPSRSGRNQRRYTDRDASDIRSIQASRDRGRTMEQAIHDLTRAEPTAMETGPTPRMAGAELHPPQEHDSPALAGARLISMLEAFDGRRANEFVAEQLWGSTFEAVCVDLLLPALWAIDEHWAAGRLAEVQARFGKAWIRRKLDSALDQSSPDLGRLHVVVAAMHDDSAGDDGVCLSILLSRAGYRVYWVGGGASLSSLDLAMHVVSPTAMILASRSQLSDVATKAAAEHLAETCRRGAWQGLIAVLGGVATIAIDAVHLPLHATQTVSIFERALCARDSTLRLVRNQ